MWTSYCAKVSEYQAGLPQPSALHSNWCVSQPLQTAHISPRWALVWWTQSTTDIYWRCHGYFEKSNFPTNLFPWLTIKWLFYDLTGLVYEELGKNGFLASNLLQVDSWLSSVLASFSGLLIREGGFHYLLPSNVQGPISLTQFSALRIITLIWWGEGGGNITVP